MGLLIIQQVAHILTTGRRRVYLYYSKWHTYLPLDAEGFIYNTASGTYTYHWTLMGLLIIQQGAHSDEFTYNTAKGTHTYHWTLTSFITLQQVAHILTTGF